MLLSSESTIVKTATIAKMPTVTPKSDKMVRVMLDFNAPQANLKLSNTCRKNFIMTL
jgi:hypothetical protein